MDELNKNEVIACLELNRHQTELFFEEHQSIFQECIISGNNGIQAKKLNLEEYIGSKIYGHISVPVLKALWNKEAIGTLLLNIEKNKELNKSSEFKRIKANTKQT